MRKSHKKKVQDRRDKRFYMAQKRLSDAICKTWEKYLNDDIKNLITVADFNDQYRTNWDSPFNSLTIDKLHDTVRLMNAAAPPPVLFPFPMKFEQIHPDHNIHSFCFPYFNLKREDSPWQIQNIPINS